MNIRTITVIDSHTGLIVETVRGAGIQDIVRVRDQYEGLEHDGRYHVEETKERFNALNEPIECTWCGGARLCSMGHR